SKTAKAPIDVVGLVLLVAGIGCMQFMLDNGNDNDWFASPMILALGLIALVSLSFLVAWELNAKHPVIDLTLFKQRNFTIGVSAMSFGMLAFFAINVVSPLWLQTTLGFTASWSGLTSAWVGVLAFVLSPVVGSLLGKFDLRAMITMAFVVLAGTSFWLSTYDSGASYISMVWPRLVMGLGIPLFFIPLNQIYLSGLPADQIASASGLANFFRTLGSSVSTALTVTLWQHRTEFHHASLTENITAAAPAATGFLQHLQAAGMAGQRGLGVVDQLISREAATLAVNDVFWLCSIIFIFMIPLLWLAKPPFGSAGGPGGH
ncbi:MAG TPA: DHA2 family efflux MFS transporter permease subunit, partial [Rhodanobacter sp.]